MSFFEGFGDELLKLAREYPGMTIDVKKPSGPPSGPTPGTVKAVKPTVTKGPAMTIRAGKPRAIPGAKVKVPIGDVK